MRRLTATSGLVVLSALCGPGFAAELDLTLGEDSLRGEYVVPIGKEVADNVSTLDLGVWYQEDKNSDGLLAHAGIMIFGDTGAKKANIKAGVGARAVLLDTDPNVNGAALTLGGTVTGRVPDFNRLGGKLWLFYAPDVSAFGDLDSYFEYGVSVDYQLIRQAYVVGGFRQLRAGINDNGKFNIESGGFLGLRLVF